MVTVDDAGEEGEQGRAAEVGGEDGKLVFKAYARVAHRAAPQILYNAPDPAALERETARLRGHESIHVEGGAQSPRACGGFQRRRDGGESRMHPLGHIKHVETPRREGVDAAAGSGAVVIEGCLRQRYRAGAEHKAPRDVEVLV